VASKLTGSPHMAISGDARNMATGRPLPMSKVVQAVEVPPCSSSTSR